MLWGPSFSSPAESRSHDPRPFERPVKFHEGITPFSIGLALITMALNSAAQLLLRASALRGATAEDPLSLMKSPLFIGALACYGLSVLTWLSVLKRLPLGAAMPFSSLPYVAVPILARFVFGDELSWRMGVGAAMIVGGVLFVAIK